MYRKRSDANILIEQGKKILSLDGIVVTMKAVFRHQVIGCRLSSEHGKHDTTLRL